ncbi:sigma-70 family RNA polymerase sigma factor [Fulvivirga maritima]|uniref:RNA polymerase sigma factor n=1 Tax=Fulvivirga maritima TaxID=2904247 RepID=UPI001F2BCED3|nr:sigma-70 family RNA polymerase sigma factor [Fulvivirga maritima]UII24958.1 sigma-70 family RNA polymerase sigma factor [Fulvivirga maritima]
MKLKIHRSEEDTLIRQCKKQDNQAQKEVYEKYASTMLGICVRYIKEPGQAEDVMINGFVKVFEKIDQFKGDGSFEGWIRRIMVNDSLTYLRQNKSMYLEVDIEKADLEPDYSSLDNQLEAEDLLTMIQQLPTGYRTVFNLYAVEGFSHREIAEQLGISENTSKSQLSRARALLQKQLLATEQNMKNKFN